MALCRQEGWDVVPQQRRRGTEKVPLWPAGGKAESVREDAGLEVHGVVSGHGRFPLMKR